MRKLPRPVEPEGYAAAYATFVQTYPPNAERRTESKRWENFKNEQQEIYTRVKDALLSSQSHLCAFCECKLTDTNREIEHFVPKSQTSADCDHTLDFTNFTMSCKGRKTQDEDDHCGHLKDKINPADCILNPYELPDFPLVRLCIHDDKLLFEPDEAACKMAGISLSLVVSTLDRLGLNCNNLQARRWQVWNELEKELDDVYTEDVPVRTRMFQALRDAHLFPRNGELIEFYTTRLLTLS